LDQAISYASGGAVVTGFTSGDDIDFRAIAFSGSVLSWNQGTGSGTLSVSSGGSSADITLLGTYTGGQSLTVTSGQTSGGLIVQGGGSPQFASASDSAGGTDVTFTPVFATVVVSSGGVASNTVVKNGGRETTRAGGEDIGTVVANGGSATDFGTAISALVSSGGTQVVDSVASDTTVLSGGVLSNTGTTFSAMLSAGGRAVVLGNNLTRAFSTTVLSGASQIIGQGIASGTVLNGGTETVSGNGQLAIEQLALVNSGGLELVTASGTLTSATISGGTVEIGTTGQLSGTASFATSGGGTVQLDQAISYASGGAVVTGFTSGDDIDFRAIAFSGSVLSWNQGTGSGTLTVSNGGASANIKLDGNYVAAQTVSVTAGVTSSGLVAGGGFGFSSSSDVSGGTDVTFGGNAQTIVVSAGGVVSNTIVNNGGLLAIRAFATDSGGTVINSGGSQTTQNGATAFGTVVGNGGLQVDGGTAISALVSNGGEQLLLPTGIASSTTVLSGGLLLNDGGNAIGAVLSSGATASFFSNGGAMRAARS
jgi:autotransporter passenger strand-loop-strand repeat protein